jgi:hypothetical protein
MLGYSGVFYAGPIARTDSVLAQVQLLDEKAHQGDVGRSRAWIMDDIRLED